MTVASASSIAPLAAFAGVLVGSAVSGAATLRSTRRAALAQRLAAREEFARARSLSLTERAGEFLASVVHATLS
jgi:hypothetical protein